MLELYYKYPRVLRRLRSGGLSGEMDRIAAYLFEHGYKRGSAKVYLSRLGVALYLMQRLAHKVQFYCTLLGLPRIPCW